MLWHNWLQMALHDADMNTAQVHDYVYEALCLFDLASDTTAAETAIHERLAHDAAQARPLPQLWALAVYGKLAREPQPEGADTWQAMMVASGAVLFPPNTIGTRLRHMMRTSGSRTAIANLFHLMDTARGSVEHQLAYLSKPERDELALTVEEIATLERLHDEGVRNERAAI